MGKYKTPVVLTADEGNEVCLRFPAEIALSRIEIVASCLDNDLDVLDVPAVEAAVRMYLDRAIGDVVGRAIWGDRIEILASMEGESDGES